MFLEFDRSSGCEGNSGDYSHMINEHLNLFDFLVERVDAVDSSVFGAFLGLVVVISQSTRKTYDS